MRAALAAAVAYWTRMSRGLDILMSALDALMTMRTTIRIDDRLLAEAKANAVRSGRTLTAVVEDALRAALRRQAPRGTPSPALPVSLGGRLQPGVDLDDSSALLDVMEGPGR